MGRDKEGVKRERNSEGSGAAPQAPTYGGKALHGINIKVESDAADTNEEA